MGNLSRFAPVAAALLAVAGCVPRNSTAAGGSTAASGGSSGGGGGGDAPPSAIAVRPDPIAFNDTSPGLSDTVQITVQNVDPANGATVSGIAVTSDPAHAFAVDPVPLPQDLPPGGAITFGARFTPPADQSYTAFLEVGVAGAPTRAVSVKGAGVVSGLSPVPALVDYGQVAQGAPERVERVAIRSIGTGEPRTISSIGLTSDAGGMLRLANVEPLPIVVQPDTQTSFQVILDPIGAPGQYQGEVQVVSDDPARPDIRVTLLVEITPGFIAPNEFRCNQTTRLDQRTASVAALPAQDNLGAVAAIVFSDQSDLGDASEAGHLHHATNALSSDKRIISGSTSPKIFHHTESIGYVGLAADGVSRQYYAAGRRHPGLPGDWVGPHPNSVFVNYMSSAGHDNGRWYLDEEHLSTGQTWTTFDIAVDPTGGARFVVLRCSGTGTPGLPEGTIARLSSRSGDLLTGWFNVNETGAARNPRVAWNGSSFLVVWEDGGSVRGHFYGPSGSSSTAEFTIETGSGAVRLPRVAGDTTTGDFAVVWQGGGDVSGRIVHPDGSMGALVPAIPSAATGTQEQPVVASYPGVGWLVAFTGPDASARGIFARKLDASFAPLDADVAVNEVVEGDQQEPAATWVPSMGQWLVVWTGQDGDGLGIKGRFLPW